MEHIIEITDRVICSKCKDFIGIPTNPKLLVNLKDRIEQAKNEFKEKHKDCK